MAAPWSGQPGAVRALWPGQIRNVAGQVREPGPVVPRGRLVRLLLCLGWVGLGHLLPAAEDELGLRVLGLLAAQRAAVVEGSDPVCGRHIGRAEAGDGSGELQNRAFRVALA